MDFQSKYSIVLMSYSNDRIKMNEFDSKKKKLMNKLSSIVKILIHSFEFRMNQFDEGVNIGKWEYNI